MRLEQLEAAFLAQQAKSKTRKKTAARQKPRSWARRWLRRLLLVAAVIVFLPIALTPIYLVPSVHPVSLLMVKDLVTLQGYRRDWVEFEDMGTVLPYSVVMSEDGQLCSHGGVDWAALSSVVEDALAVRVGDAAHRREGGGRPG